MYCIYPNSISVREKENNAGLYYWTTQTTLVKMQCSDGLFANVVPVLFGGEVLQGT
jgi:hypothetical protein